MSYKFADRVKEFTTTTGTGAVALGGAASGYRGFGAVLTDGDTCGYCIADPNTGEWEVGTRHLYRPIYPDPYQCAVRHQRHLSC